MSTRLRHRENQTIRAVHLRDEQTYHVAARRRHELSAHDWGIVRGLTLVDSEPKEIVTVQPGVAVDWYGRMITLMQPLVLYAHDFEEFGGLVEIGIHYNLTAISDSRREESGLVFAADLVVQRDDVETDYLHMNDLPSDASPIYLGTVVRDRMMLRKYTESKKLRRYTRFYAGSMLAPDGRVQLMLDTEAENDSRRFAVATIDSAGGNLQDRLRINRIGDTYLYGDVHVKSEPTTPSTLSLFGLHFEPHAPPTEAQPWRVYAARGTEGEGADQRPYSELRVELFHPGKVGEPKDYRLEIYPDAKRDSVPIFTVIADGTVIVRGEVKADQVLQAPIDADPTDPRFQALLADPAFVNQGLEVTFPDGRNGVITSDQPVTPRIQLKNARTEAISSIEVYADITAKNGRRLFGGQVTNIGSLDAKTESKVIEFTEISLGESALIAVVVYGSNLKKDIVVGFALVDVVISSGEVL